MYGQVASLYVIFGINQKIKQGQMSMADLGGYACLEPGFLLRLVNEMIGPDGIMSKSCRSQHYQSPWWVERFR